MERIKMFPASTAYFLRRMKFKFFKNDLYIKFNYLRKNESQDGHSLKPFEEYQCIFIHIPKCAGQSIRNSLFDNLLPGHITVYTYQMIYPKRTFDKFFKFTIVRNPWDRLVSSYLFLKGGGAHQMDQQWADKHLRKFSSFEEFVKSGLPNQHIRSYPHFRPQNKFLVGQEGDIPVDFIGRVETLQEDFQTIKNELKTSQDLLYVNKTPNKKRDFRKYYTEETKKIVFDIYNEDIILFNYDFDNYWLSDN